MRDSSIVRYYIKRENDKLIPNWVKLAKLREELGTAVRRENKALVAKLKYTADTYTPIGRVFSCDGDWGMVDMQVTYTFHATGEVLTMDPQEITNGNGMILI